MKGVLLLLAAMPALVLCLYEGQNSHTAKTSLATLKADDSFGETPTHDRYIVHLSREFSLGSLEDHLSTRSKTLNVHHRYSKLLHGLTVSGVELEHIVSHPGVLRADKDSLKHKMAYSWGVDRINQKDLPLDFNTTTAYHGEGIDVYVLDTGLDTTHVEFARNAYNRKVRCFDAIPKNGITAVTASVNNDGNGHGTHVAATIGGNTVGVSPGVNIYAIKVLDDNGSGYTSLIVGALEWVAELWEILENRPSIVSMSLGSACESSDCQTDALVIAVEALVALANGASRGIKVSVAAGNDGANACFSSPSAGDSLICNRYLILNLASESLPFASSLMTVSNVAASAFVSGASSKSDQVAPWSNFGQCVDVFAPGVDIVSALTSTLASTNSSYLTLSGTSMACPHTTGVLAQLMQKSPTASNEELRSALTCDGAQSRLTLDSLDQLSRNILLQTPTVNESAAASNTCDLGTGCADDCSSRGVCGPIPTSNSTYVCHCDNGYEGSACSAASATCSSGAVQVQVGDNGLGIGWGLARYAILDSEGLIAADASDSLAAGENYGSRSYCIAAGTYTFQVTRGENPLAVVWSVCGELGGGPFLGTISVRSGGDCKFVCSYATIKLLLNSASNSGWQNAYYGLYSEASGTQLYGGTMFTTDVENFTVCLADGTYILLFEQIGDDPKDVSIGVCSVRVGSKDIVRLTIADGKCTASLINPTIDGCSADHGLSQLRFKLFSPGRNGWGGNTVTLGNSALNVSVVAPANMTFLSVIPVCLPNGCYSLDIDGDTRADFDDAFWIACSFKGSVPWHADVCVDSAYGLCYGLTGCPIIKSYSKTSFLQWFFVYSDSGDEVFELGNVHSVQELCELPDGCYNFMVGAGFEYDDNSVNSVNICGTKTTLSSTGRICVNGSAISLGHYGRSEAVCVASDVVDTRSLCNAGVVLNPLVLLSRSAKGWSNLYYYIETERGSTIYYGTLASGQISIDYNCFEKGARYYLSTDYSYEDDALFIMCGQVGGMGIYRAEFVVTSSGCYFTSTGGGGNGNYGYYSTTDDETDDGSANDDNTYGNGGGVNVTDDDFPNFVAIITTFPPTLKPSLNSTKAPGLAPAQSPADSSDFIDVVIASSSVLMRMTFSAAVSDASKELNLRFFSDSIRRVLDLSKFSIINVETTLPSLTQIYGNDARAYMYDVTCTTTVVLGLTGENSSPQREVDEAVSSFDIKDSPEDTVTGAFRTIESALSSGLLQQLANNALSYQQRSRSAFNLKSAEVNEVTFLEYSTSSVPRVLLPGVDKDYDNMWGDWKSKESKTDIRLHLWLIVLLTSLGTLCMFLCCWFCIGFCVRRVFKSARPRVEEQGGASAPPAAASGGSRFGLMGSAPVDDSEGLLRDVPSSNKASVV